MRVQAHHPPQIERSPHTWFELGAGVLCTVLIHGVLLAWMLGGSDEAAAPSREALVVETELLQWGEALPNDNELPTIANPAPSPLPPESQTQPPQQEVAEAPTEVVDLQRSDEPAEVEVPTEIRSELREDDREREIAQNRGETNPYRPINNEPVIGLPDGFRGGTSLSASAQRNQLARIMEQLQQQFRPPSSLSDAELARLGTTIYVEIEADGRISAFRTVSSSGNRAFDSAARQAINRFSRGPLRLDMASIANAEFRELITQSGLNIRMVGR